MYSVKPIGLNTKNNDRDVADGSLIESINMQWRDGAFKPIPERLSIGINASGYTNIILHKVGDEDTINVLGFNLTPGTGSFLAFDLAGYLGGEVIGGYILEWFGTITNGVYASRTITQLPFVMTPGMSFTILNGITYFMGDGSSPEEQYYIRMEFDEATQVYKMFDMYRWKTLIPFYPYQADIALLAPKKAHNAFSQCGLVLIRFAIVLKSGEVVLHSPIYGYLMYGINRSDNVFKKGDAIENIHAFINLDLSFADSVLLDEEVSAINIYASTADYESKFLQDYSAEYSTAYLFKKTDIKGKMGKKAEEPFYLVKTIDKPTATEKLLLTVGAFDTDIEFPALITYTYSRVDITTIAAGGIMPVDNFSYHKLFGKITSYNGRLVIKRPVTVLSGGYMRALSTIEKESDQAFSIITEDGTLNGVSYSMDKAIEYSETGISLRGMLSYPDIRASLIGSNNESGADIRMFKCRKNTAHNMSCNFSIFNAEEKTVTLENYSIDTSKLKTVTDYCIYTSYDNSVAATGGNYVIYSVPPEQIDGRDTFQVPDKIDLARPTHARSTTQIFVQDEDYTIDNAGIDDKGRFIFSVAPIEDLVLRYYTAIIIPPHPEIPAVTPSGTDANTKYTSENRLQFAQIGEFKIWPTINSHRVGEGKIMNLGIGSVSSGESQIISPLIVGTTDGVYTINLDPMGNNFIASITRSKNIPFISEEVLEIDNDILFVGDQGLMVFSNGDYQNLTIDFFPQQGHNSEIPTRISIFPDYNTLTSDFFGNSGNPYFLDDVVKYMKGAILAYDGRRRNIWCSNPSYSFSLVFNLDVKQWTMSTIVFTEKQELFSTLELEIGDIYSRYLIKQKGENNLQILSGEDISQEVFYHIMTRPIKFQNTDEFKVLTRMVSRTLLVRCESDEYFPVGIPGYFSIGIWGQQEVNEFKKSIPIAIKKDDRNLVYPSDMRYHIPIDCRKGKYKVISVLQAGKTLPESYISSFDFDIYLVDNNKMR